MRWNHVQRIFHSDVSHDDVYDVVFHVRSREMVKLKSLRCLMQKTEELRMLFLGAVKNELTVHVLAWKCDEFQCEFTALCSMFNYSPDYSIRDLRTTARSDHGFDSVTVDIPQVSDRVCRPPAGYSHIVVLG